MSLFVDNSSLAGFIVFVKCIVYIVDMRETHIKNLDLNLLVALNALLEEKHVSRAAERINLSQPATSRALARLRAMFQDPLLVKGKSGMTLTARAQDLYEPLQNILREVGQMVSPATTDPAQMQGEIVIATRDYELATILPVAISKITALAPNLKLSIVPIIGDDFSPLENHHVDFILAGTEKSSSTLHRSTVLEEGFACLTAKNNKAVGSKLTLSSFIKMKHCLITTSNIGTGIVDSLLAAKNIKRNVVLRMPHFLAAAPVIAHSDLIITLPRSLAIKLAKDQGLKLHEPPLKIPKFPLYLYWHTRNQTNPIHQFIRKIIKNVS